MTRTLTPGAHNGSLTQNCIMEHVALQYLRGQGIISNTELLAHKTDSPGCTARWIIGAAQRVNDRVLNPNGRTPEQLAENERLLLALSDRLLYEARIPADLEKRKRVAVRVACWAARSVLHLVRDQAAALGAIEAAEGWLTGSVTVEELWKARELSTSAAYTAYTAAYADAAAYTAAYADAAYTAYTAYTAAAYTAYDAAASATAAASADADAAASAAADAAASAADREAILWLDGLLDAHVKALAEEGLLGAEDAFEVWAVESCPV